ncbi:MAG: NADH:ubiquinone oxidoreductase subunit 5 (chain L)/Multisubunit Na+/H+ antiporter, MnhA subunit [Candidatus Jettenia ecosi]|uniref:NADH:ubiquinone oxidoreductase subunit 5 (Chain L)/Multisubunit Na+/H+ antiporter, MnhA subunit n=1 Tax=Candidatus Jettenia ecosi TaxID=2494326 RepID=A0A533QB15_9BACT|nr:MAG: NADH:ubiquinone oxidoreductase subunit 5 (chain L)/Multisubunit Na+/H+ antiporter, MnhA subunit [Candidatus Jettenia ecosi]
MIKDPRTHAIIGVAMEVHNFIGPGHLETVYQECLEIELELRSIPFIHQPRLEIFYKNQKLKKFYIPDFIVYNEIVVEIKAEKLLTKIDEAQLINSLIISRHNTGLLLNFGEETLRYRRFVN